MGNATVVKPKITKPRKKKSKVVWQGHHVLYQDRHGEDWVLDVRKSVHYIIAKIGRYTRGFTMQEKAALHCAVELLPLVRTEEVE